MAAAMDAPVHPAADPLRLSVCPACGYSLRGLPDAGACPECGRCYDQETVVLHGWARGSHANLGNASPKIIAWLLVPPVLALPVLIASWLAAGTPFPWFALVILTTPALLLWRRWMNPLPSVLQVHLSRSGCREVDHITPLAPALKPWTELDRVEIEPFEEGRCRLRIGRRPNWFGLAPALTVDAEIKCTFEQAESLRQRIAGWRAEAEASAPTGGFPVVQKRQ